MRSGSATNSKQVNHPTVGRIPGGALVERDSALDLAQLQHLSLLLNDASFTTAEEVAAVINQEWLARASGHGGRQPPGGNSDSGPAAPAQRRTVPALLARIENLGSGAPRAKVVVNERTGTVVLGQDVRLGAVSILHGNFSIEVTTPMRCRSPTRWPRARPKSCRKPKLKATEAPARNVEFSEGASVEQLVTRLQAIGATARDVISILQAIKSAGALEAELEVI